MKKIFLMLMIMVGTFTACTDQFADFNTDKKNPAVVPGETLFTNAQKELTDYISNTNVNINIFKLMAQYWTETTYIDEANYDLVTRNISTNVYSRLYLRVLTDLKEASMVIDGTEVVANLQSEKDNKLAIIELLNVYTYAQMVDIFGAIPYTEALNPDNVYPAYDGGAAVYADLMVRLDAAIAKLDANATSFGAADLYYGGDTEKWVKFAKGLKVKLAIVTADANTAASKTAVESAYAGVLASNDDNCQLTYLTSSPNYNQLYADLVASGRKDFVPANTIVDAMVSLSDPRMDAYFADQIDTSTVDGVVKLAWIGGAYGFPNSYNQVSHLGTVIETPDYPGVMMSYAEVCFYLAEAAERGYSVGGTAEAWYNKGIAASFDEWGVAGADAYIATPAVAYTTASGTWKQKIGLQSWIANYVRGDVAYNNIRRLDAPAMNIPESGETLPTRYTFPVNEQTLNEDEYAAAVTLIGGSDTKAGKVFWDKN